MMKQYLIETFRYNDFANKLALAKIHQLGEKDECIHLFSHMVNSMNKWLGRIEQWPNYAEMDWWLPVYTLDELGAKWEECLLRWVASIESKTNEYLSREVEFIGFDGGRWAATPRDIAIQLNYHSIHHRPDSIPHPQARHRPRFCGLHWHQVPKTLVS